MAIRYYDEAIVYKLRQWLPDTGQLRVIGPEETKRLFELTANDSNDKAFQLPFIALSRNTDIELLSNVKSNKSFDGFRVNGRSQLPGDVLLNALPIKLEYKLDIYAKYSDEADEYLRNFVFKLINNPQIYITIPYNDYSIEHVANIRVLSTLSDTSDIGERLFAGEFKRWSISLEIHDAFLFSIPYKNNWRIMGELIPNQGEKAEFAGESPEN